MDLDQFTATDSDVSTFFAIHPDKAEGQRTKNARRVEPAPLPRHGKGERFICGPIPLEWMKLASKCGNRSEAVAVLLWYAAGFQRSNPVKLSKTILAELAVHPKTAKRVLQRMAEYGLVDVEFHRGRSPSVTIKKPTTARHC